MILQTHIHNSSEHIRSCGLQRDKRYDNYESYATVSILTLLDFFYLVTIVYWCVYLHVSVDACIRVPINMALYCSYLINVLFRKRRPCWHLKTKKNNKYSNTSVSSLIQPCIISNIVLLFLLDTFICDEEQMFSCLGPLFLNVLVGKPVITAVWDIHINAKTL